MSSQYQLEQLAASTRKWYRRVEGVGNGSVLVICGLEVFVTGKVELVLLGILSIALITGFSRYIEVRQNFLNRRLHL